VTIDTAALSRAAGLAAAAAGLIFTGVQIGHPQLNAISVTTTEVLIRDCLKIVMAALALAGLAGLYLRQVKQSGVLGLVGYLTLSTGYLLMTCTAFAAAFILPSIAGAAPDYVNAVTAAATARPATGGDIGLLAVVIHVQDVAYLAGGLIFGVALFRARILPRWAAALLAAGGVVTIALSYLPDAFYRLLAFPNGIAMVALGYSLWRAARTTTAPVAEPAAQLSPAGAE
jgi:hypothetical protein